MWVKEQRHSTGAEVTVSVDVSASRVDLRVSPEVTNSLYVNHYQLMTRSLKWEMTKRLQHIKTPVS